MRNPVPKLFEKLGATQIAMVTVLMSIGYVMPVAAQDGGLCSLPGGNNLIGMFGLIVQGVIVLGGVYLLVQGVSSMFGAGRGSGGRSNLLYGVLIVMFGLLLPQFVAFIAEQAGASLDDAGLGCLFG